MKSEVWKPIYVDEFPTQKYLYHYTSVETAIKIICSNSLLFSKIGNTNDTSESKMKIAFSEDNISDVNEYNEKVAKISRYFKKSREIVQLLCFSMDCKLSRKEIKRYKSLLNDKELYYDVSGRGFALPRMWAQYASDNEGVCFIFDRNMLLENIKRKLVFCESKPVKYKNFFDKYFITSEQMDKLYERISMISNGSLTLLNMVQGDKDFLEYNYFEKLDDWKNEHEYRVLALVDNSNNNRIQIEKVLPCLEGIVVGEKIDSAYEEAIKLLISNSKMKCEVKKIRFDSSICKLV